MIRHTKIVVRLIATLCTTVAFAQVASTQTNSAIQDSTSSAPVAYVYVSDVPNNMPEIHAFAAAANGRLTPVSGSPFPGGAEDGMAVNGKYLFGTDGVYIYSFSIASDGALKRVASINAEQFNQGGCGGPGALFLDHTGTSLYTVDFNEDCSGSDDAYQSFSIDNSTGQLSYLGVSSATRAYYVPMSFIGNNKYAYGAQCNSNMYWSIFGFQRGSDGLLNSLNTNPPTPKAKPGDFYCPNFSTADPTNHVAFSMQAVNGSTFNSDGPPQLATYTADSSGNLTTKSTRFNMPATAAQNLTDIWMSPSGKLLAVGGTAGLQVFHFNGSNQISHYTGLLTKDSIDQFFWDNNNHLYAISHSAGKLFVYTITPTSFSRAPGSPYSVTDSRNISVLPKK